MSALPSDMTLSEAARIGSRRWIWWTIGSIGTLLLLSGIWFVVMVRAMADENTPPPNLDRSRTRVSAQGLYHGTYTPSLDPLTIDTLHSWTLHLTTADGQPVDNAMVSVHGDMPGHGHGLPTRPIVSSLGNGAYMVEGMKFQMHGWWYVELDILVEGQLDTVRFDLVLN